MGEGGVMGGIFQQSRDADGWSWRFKNNKADTTIPIRNLFHKEVEKIATSFYITNFPDYVEAKRLWKECEPYGRIVDSFIANKKSRVGKRFGFVRFTGVKNEEELENTLATTWIGSYHLFVAVARFKRKETHAELPKKTVENNRSQIPDNKVEEVAFTQSKKTYASTLNGDRGSKAERQETKMKQVTLSDHELVQINNSLEIALVKVKSVETMSTLYRLCCEEGFNEVKIHHIGGLWLWLQFQNEETCNAFKKNNNLKSFFSLIKPVSKNFSVDERMVWVEILGLPLCAWGSNAYKKFASTVEDLASQETDFDSHEGDEGDKERDFESIDDIEEDEQVARQDNKKEEKEQEKQQAESILSNTGNEEKTPPIESDINKGSVTSDWSRPPDIAEKISEKLGYDVKGCHKSLHRLIDRIGVLMVDK
ncbi:RNA-directed DNA polymerase, eukaryota, reverse transcriptase zinc-binding domain protein [Tanacetum coccineum]